MSKGGRAILPARGPPACGAPSCAAHSILRRRLGRHSRSTRAMEPALTARVAPCPQRCSERGACAPLQQRVGFPPARGPPACGVPRTAAPQRTSRRPQCHGPRAMSALGRHGSHRAHSVAASAAHAHHFSSAWPSPPRVALQHAVHRAQQHPSAEPSAGRHVRTRSDERAVRHGQTGRGAGRRGNVRCMSFRSEAAQCQDGAPPTRCSAGRLQSTSQHAQTHLGAIDGKRPDQ